MNEPGQVPGQVPPRLPQNNPQGTGAPRPVMAQPVGPPRAPIQPPPAQRLPGQGMPQGTGVAQPPRLPHQGGHAPSPGRQAPMPIDDDGDLINLDDDDAPSPAPVGHPVPAAGHSNAGVAHAAGHGSVAGAAQVGAGHVGVGQIAAPSKIKVNTGGDKHTYNRFKRDLSHTGTTATRVRSFHGRLSDDGLAYTDDKINEWLDSHPEVEIKHVNCIVGPLEGKVTGEQGLIVVIWY